MDDIPIYPFYGSTYTLYRVSPLYHGSAALLTDDGLKTHARRIRDLLKGDTVRGVHIGQDGTGRGNSKSGTLADCTWDLIGDEASWKAAHQPQPDDSQHEISTVIPPGTANNARGIHIQLHYERATHSAMLLRDPASEFSIPGFTALPLLLVRMPASVRETFINYLSTTFDARISPMKLRSTFLTSSLEQLLTRLCHDSTDAASQSLSPIIKAIQVQLSFPSVAPLLRNIDITIAKEDVEEFLRRGRELASLPHAAVQKRQATDAIITGDFTRALSAYLKAHSALSLDTPGITISKIACGPFALAEEGKMKLFSPQPSPTPNAISTTAPDDSTTLTPTTTASPSDIAMRDFYTALLREAEGRHLLHSGLLSSHEKGKRALDDAPREGDHEDVTQVAKRQKPGPEVVGVGTGAERLSVPADPPPPYELHDPARRGE